MQQVEQFVRGRFGGAGLLVLKPIGCVVLAMAFVGAAAALHRLVSRMRQEQEAKPADATVLSAA